MAILFGIVDTSILEYHEFDTLKSIVTILFKYRRYFLKKGFWQKVSGRQKWIHTIPKKYRYDTKKSIGDT